MSIPLNSRLSVKVILTALLMAIAGLAVACGGGEDVSPAQDGHDVHGGAAEGGFGEAASLSDATRTVEVEALDELVFSPDTITVQSGEVVAFKVTNTGKAKHEFVLGDETYQEMHEEGMSSADQDVKHRGNAVQLDPGETRTLAWRFSEAGKVLYGCHEPGHYEGGMVGTISVS
jgi:uncharacterized cupredoxin-like copper-binding protein